MADIALEVIDRFQMRGPYWRQRLAEAIADALDRLPPSGDGEREADDLGLHERRPADVATDPGTPQGDGPATEVVVRLTEEQAWLVSDALSAYQSRWRNIENDGGRFGQAMEADRKVLDALGEAEKG